MKVKLQDVVRECKRRGISFASDEIDEERKKEIYKLLKGNAKVLADCIKDLKNLRSDYARKIVQNTIYWGPMGQKLKFEKMLSNTWIKLTRFIEELEDCQKQANIDAKDFK